MATFSLVGSERTAMPGAECTGAADPAERLTVTLIVRRRAEREFHGLVEKLSQGDRSFKPLSREEYEKRFGADPHDLSQVAAFAKAHDLLVERQDGARRMVVLSGTVAQFNTAFGVDLQHYRHGAGTYRGRIGVVTIPDTLRDVITAVLGLDNRPQARTHFRFRPPIRSASGPAASYTPDQVASLYKFPEGTGGGQCVGLIELGGGYNASDLQTYFSKLGVALPTVVAVPVGSAGNQPTGDAGGPDGEVTLDIEVVGAIVPEARIAVYFAENTDAGFIDAVGSAVHDAVNKPSVISISWGGPESSWTAQSMNSFDQVLQAAATMGITVCAASGDNGSSDGATTSGNHVDFPASSPYALGCGGTSLHASATAVESEGVWNGGAQGGSTGGGVSTFFALPAWQKGLQTTGKGGKRSALAKRGVPDVAGDADPATGYSVLVDGSETVVGGTSAVAPLWAALIARINAAQSTPVGYINAKLYQQPAAFNDITQGNNGAFTASPGWDACTGLGSPNGMKISQAL
jgi:kumamolisin